MPGYDPDPKTEIHVWPLDCRQHRPRSVRRADAHEDLAAADLSLLGEVGAYGVNFHDNDLIPIESTPEQAKQIVKEFKKSLKETAWSCRWRRRISFPIRSSRMARSPATMRKSAPMRFRRRCGRWNLGGNRRQDVCLLGRA